MSCIKVAYRTPSKFGCETKAKVFSISCINMTGLWLSFYSESTGVTTCFKSYRLHTEFNFFYHYKLKVKSRHSL